MDGRYIAKGREVHRTPTKTDTGYTMGFRVCTLAPEVADEAAIEIAEALNLHMQHHPDRH